VTDTRVERTRLAVLSEARRLLIEEGWDSVTHLRVAQAGGVSRATLYRHWPGRSDLLHDVLRREAEMSHTSPPSGGLREDLVAECEALRRQLAEPGLTGVLAALIDRSLHDPELGRVMDSFHQEVSRVVRAILRRAMETGELPPDLDLDLAVAALLVIRVVSS
jgi:AcrR family transcriptional regulator